MSGYPTRESVAEPESEFAPDGRRRGKSPPTLFREFEFEVKFDGFV